MASLTIDQLACTSRPTDFRRKMHLTTLACRILLMDTRSHPDLPLTEEKEYNFAILNTIENAPLSNPARKKGPSDSCI